MSQLSLSPEIAVPPGELKPARGWEHWKPVCRECAVVQARRLAKSAREANRG